MLGNSIFQMTASGASGAYQFNNLNPGHYSLSVGQQPAGFRPGLPTAGSLGGISPHNNQIAGIVVATNSNGTGYNFGEIPSAAPTTGAGPGLVAELADDTGVSATDGLTSDLTIQGSVHSGSLASLTASIDGKTAISVLNQVTSGGTFVLNAGLVGQLAGGALADGSHTLHVTATDLQGNSSTVNVSFTLQTAAPTLPTIGFASGSNKKGGPGTKHSCFHGERQRHVHAHRHGSGRRHSLPHECREELDLALPTRQETSRSTTWLLPWRQTPLPWLRRTRPAM